MSEKMFIVDETGAEFASNDFQVACNYLEENYGDSSETNEEYSCFKGDRWIAVKNSQDFVFLKNYCEFEEGISVSYH